MDFFRNLLAGPESLKQEPTPTPKPVPSDPDENGSVSTAPDPTLEPEPSSMFDGMSTSGDSMFSGLSTDSSSWESEPSAFSFMTSTSNTSQDVNVDGESSFSFISDSPQAVAVISETSINSLSEHPSRVSSSPGSPPSIVPALDVGKRRVGIANRPGRNTPPVPKKTQTGTNFNPAPAASENPSSLSNSASVSVPEDLEDRLELPDDELKTPSSEIGPEQYPSGSSLEPQKVGKTESPVFVAFHAVQERLSALSDQVDEISQTQLVLTSMTRDSYTRMFEIEQLIRSYELKQIQLVEDENFEVVEEYSHQIDELRHELVAINQRIRESAEKFVQFEDDKISIRNTLVTIQGGAVDELLALEKSQQKIVENKEKRLKEEIEDGEFRIGSKELAHEKSSGHIESELASINEREKRIRDIVNERTVSEREERTQWQRKRDALQVEIDNLRRELELKEAEAHICDENLERIDQNMVAASERYGSDLGQIEIDRKRILEDLAEQQRQGILIAEAKATWQQSLKDLQLDLDNEVVLMNQISETIQLHSSMLSERDLILHESELIKQMEIDELDELRFEDSQLVTLKSEIASMTNSINETSTEILHLRAEIKANEISISTIMNTTIPALEEDKANAVKHRNFKVAKTIQDELKNLATQITDSEQTKTRYEENLSSAKVQMNQTQELLNVRIEELKQKTRAIDLERLVKLRDKIAKLRLQIRNLEAASSQSFQFKRASRLLETLLIWRSIIVFKYDLLDEELEDPVEAKFESETDIADSVVPEITLQDSIDAEGRGNDPLQQDPDQEDEDSLFVQLQLSLPAYASPMWTLTNSNEVNEVFEDEKLDDTDMPITSGLEETQVTIHDLEIQKENLMGELASYESELNDAVNREDFDAADDLNTKIESVNSRLIELDELISGFSPSM